MTHPMMAMVIRRFGPARIAANQTRCFLGRARSPIFIRSSSSSEGPQKPALRKTPLYDLHFSYRAKMVPFGGFHMPMHYSAQSISESHNFTRTHASLFDVSHMVQRRLMGPGAAVFLQRVTPTNCIHLPARRSMLSVLLHPGTGGIVDDTMITRLSADTGKEGFHLVTNAACRDKDDAYLGHEIWRWNAEPSHDDQHVRMTNLDGWGLVALQGPASANILGRCLSAADYDLTTLHFGSCMRATLKTAQGESQALLVSRGGYTGEDGFEISIPPSETVAVVEALLAAGSDALRLAGLGARDSLRLEAGMCLYGHDLDDLTTPVEAGLGWVVAKDRRTGTAANFHGAGKILLQLTPKSKGGLGVSRRRVGMLVEGAPAREGCVILDRESGDDVPPIGNVTSGCPSPTLRKNIAMGYVKDGFHKPGTEVDVLVRSRRRKATITKMPFVPTKYWKGLAPT